MELSRGILLALVIALLISLLAPEVEGAPKRNRGRALANRGAGVRSRGLQGRLGRLKGGKRGRGRKGRRRARKVKRRRTGRWEEGDPPMDAAPLEDDAAADPGALDAAAAAGEEAGVCEVIMFDRGEGTYSLKFVQNAC